MLILFYFVRVGLQHLRSVQSQMMQLELRMALCQFIHNYAEDSEKLHAKTKQVLRNLRILFSLHSFHLMTKSQPHLMVWNN